MKVFTCQTWIKVVITRFMDYFTKVQEDFVPLLHRKPDILRSPRFRVHCRRLVPRPVFADDLRLLFLFLASSRNALFRTRGDNLHLI